MNNLFKNNINVLLSSLKIMSNITEEEKNELIVGFIRHVFDEVQTEGWKTRRNEFLTQQESYVEDDDEDQSPDDMTFDKAMEIYGNTDETIEMFLYPVISNPQWIEAWIQQMRPDLDRRPISFCRYWSFWNELNEFLYESSINIVSEQMFLREINYDKVKEIVGLDFDFK